MLSACPCLEPCCVVVPSSPASRLCYDHHAVHSCWATAARGAEMAAAVQGQQPQWQRPVPGRA
jgi:hypothetical protein